MSSDSIELRPYQSEAIESLRGSLFARSDAQRARRVVCALPTGSGKTLVGAMFAKRYFLDKDEGQRVWWVCHTKELLDNAYRQFVQLGFPALEIACSYDGVRDVDKYPKSRLHLFSRGVELPARTPAPTLLVVDEAHHAPANVYRKWFEKAGAFDQRETAVVGLTATAFRRASREYQQLAGDFLYSRDRPFFSKVAFARSYYEIAEAGYLAPFLRERWDTGLPFELEKSTSFFDFTARSMRQLDRQDRNEKIVERWAGGRARYGKTLVFAVDQEHARSLAATFTARFGAGVADYAISGEGGARRTEVVEAFEKGRLQVLVNVALFTEGFDVPDIRTVILARPTMSPIMFLQMMGRGSRLSPGKTTFNLIDVHDQLGTFEDYLVADVGGFPGDPVDCSGQMRQLAQRRRLDVDGPRAASAPAPSPVPAVSRQPALAEPRSSSPGQMVGWIRYYRPTSDFRTDGDVFVTGATVDATEWRLLAPFAEEGGRILPAASWRMPADVSLLRPMRERLAAGNWAQLSLLSAEVATQAPAASPPAAVPAKVEPAVSALSASERLLLAPSFAAAPAGAAGWMRIHDATTRAELAAHPVALEEWRLLCRLFARWRFAGDVRDVFSSSLPAVRIVRDALDSKHRVTLQLAEPGGRVAGRMRYFTGDDDSPEVEHEIGAVARLHVMANMTGGKLLARDFFRFDGGHSAELTLARELLSAGHWATIRELPPPPVAAPVAPEASVAPEPAMVAVPEASGSAVVASSAAATAAEAGGAVAANRPTTGMSNLAAKPGWATFETQLGSELGGREPLTVAELEAVLPFAAAGLLSSASFVASTPTLRLLARSLENGVLVRLHAYEELP